MNHIKYILLFWLGHSLLMPLMSFGTTRDLLPDPVQPCETVSATQLPAPVFFDLAEFPKFQTPRCGMAVAQNICGVNEYVFQTRCIFRGKTGTAAGELGDRQIVTMRAKFPQYFGNCLDINSQTFYDDYCRTRVRTTAPGAKFSRWSNEVRFPSTCRGHGYCAR
jgi:hypothetical protein